MSEPIEIPKTPPARIMLRSKTAIPLSSLGLTVLSTLMADSADNPDIIEYFKRIANFDDPFIVPLVSIINTKIKISYQTTVHVSFSDGFNFVYSLEGLTTSIKDDGKQWLSDFIKDDLALFDLVGEEGFIAIELYDKKYLKPAEFQKVIKTVILDIKNNTKDQND